MQALEQFYPKIVIFMIIHSSLISIVLNKKVSTVFLFLLKKHINSLWKSLENVSTERFNYVLEGNKKNYLDKGNALKFCTTKFLTKKAHANNTDPDQTAPEEAV